MMEVLCVSTIVHYVPNVMKLYMRRLSWERSKLKSKISYNNNI